MFLFLSGILYATLTGFLILIIIGGHKLTTEKLNKLDSDLYCMRLQIEQQVKLLEEAKK